MDVIRIDNLFARRSVRRYTPETVTAEQIELLLKAGMAAPSAANRQPWHFIVITSRAVLDHLAEAHPYAQMLHEAPLAFCICGDPVINDRYWVQDTSAATENVLLAAVGLGLGTVWLGVHPNTDRVQVVRQALYIPEPIVPLNLIAIGHPAENLPPRTQYNPERLHRDRW